MLLPTYLEANEKEPIVINVGEAPMTVEKIHGEAKLVRRSPEDLLLKVASKGKMEMDALNRYINISLLDN